MKIGLGRFLPFYKYSMWQDESWGCWHRYKHEIGFLKWKYEWGGMVRMESE